MNPFSAVGIAMFAAMAPAACAALIYGGMCIEEASYKSKRIVLAVAVVIVAATFVVVLGAQMWDAAHGRAK